MANWVAVKMAQASAARCRWLDNGTFGPVKRDPGIGDSLLQRLLFPVLQMVTSGSNHH